MRTLKPWTSVSQELSRSLAALLAERPVQLPGHPADWLGRVTLRQSYLCENMCSALPVTPAIHPRSRIVHSLGMAAGFGGQQVPTAIFLQLVLRLQFAVDFCRHDSAARRKAPWTGDLRSDIRLVTIRLFREHLFAWSSRFYP